MRNFKPSRSDDRKASKDGARYKLVKVSAADDPSFQRECCDGAALFLRKVFQVKDGAASTHRPSGTCYAIKTKDIGLVDYLAKVDWRKFVFPTRGVIELHKAIIVAAIDDFVGVNEKNTGVKQFLRDNA